MNSDEMAGAAAGIYIVSDWLVARNFPEINGGVIAVVLCVLVAICSEIDFAAFRPRQVMKVFATTALLFAGGNLGNDVVRPTVSQQSAWLMPRAAYAQPTPPPTPQRVKPWIGS